MRELIVPFDASEAGGQKDVQATRKWNASGYKYRRQVKNRVLAQLGAHGRGPGLEAMIGRWEARGEHGRDVLWDVMLVACDELVADFDESYERLMRGATHSPKVQEAREKEWRYGPGAERHVWADLKKSLAKMPDDCTVVDLAVAWLHAVSEVAGQVLPVHGESAGLKGWQELQQPGALTKRGKGTGKKRK
jgi:hypothetical protein